MSFIKPFYRVCAIRNTFKNLIRPASTSSTSPSWGSVSLNSVFEDTNKLRVIEKLKASKPLKRPDLSLSSAEDNEAGVLVPMCHINGEPSFLFMVRSLNLRNHRGETRYLYYKYMYVQLYFQEQDAANIWRFSYINVAYEIMFIFGQTWHASRIQHKYFHHALCLVMNWWYTLANVNDSNFTVTLTVIWVYQCRFK